jgi:hypothetical protein
MTRPSRREIEKRVADLRDSGSDTSRPVFAWVNVDPVTNRLYDGRGADPEPVREPPDADTVVLNRRTVSMELDEAEADHRTIVGVDHESAPHPLAIVRVGLADSVDEEAAITVDDLPDEQLADDSVIDFGAPEWSLR